MDESKKITTLTGETIDYTPIKYNPNAPKITQDDLDKKIKEKQARQEQLRQESSNRKMQQHEMESEQLFASSLEASDDKVRQQYTSASRISDMAGVIRDYAKNNGIDLSNATDNDVVAAFMQSNPNKANGINDYINGTTDLYTTSSNIGFIKPQQQVQDNEGGFFTDVVGGAYDSVTSLPRFAMKGVANAIGWVAKQFGADEDRVNELVQSYKDSLQNFSGEALGADTDSLAYKGTKLVGDLAQTATYGGLAKAGLKSALGGYPLVTKASPLGAKIVAGGLEGAADMGIYSAVSDSELPSGSDLALGAVTGGVFPLAGAGLKAAGKVISKNSTNMAESLIGAMNKMSKGNQMKFYNMMGEKATKWMNDRGIRDGADLINYFQTSKKIVDDNLASIQGRFSSPELTEVVDDVVAYSQKTKDPLFERFIELQTKNSEGGLTMAETNEVKRYFEKKRKFSYNKDTPAEQRDMYTNMDNRLRDWQLKVAEEQGFTDMAALNRETQGAYSLWKMIDNNDALQTSIGLSDWLVLAEGGITANSLEKFIAKKIFESTRFKNKSIDVLNKLGKHQNVGNKVMDMIELSKVKNEKDLNKWLKNVNWDEAGNIGQDILIAGEENLND